MDIRRPNFRSFRFSPRLQAASFTSLCCFEQLSKPASLILGASGSAIVDLGRPVQDQLLVSVMDASQVAEARRLTVTLATRMGLNETETGTLAIVVTEMTTNLIKHAGGGLLLLRALDKESGVDAGIEIMALDKGPGIIDLAQSVRDGYSTAGTPGGGLGAIHRLSTSFDLYSVPASGTALLARSGSRSSRAKKRPEPFEIGVVCLPKPGEQACGDSWDVAYSNQRSLFLVADGLGHGPSAAEASQEAVRIFRKNLDRNPASIVEVLHAALRSTRGAVLAVIEIDASHDQLKMAGVGNISAAIVLSENRRHLVSLNGTVGRDVLRIQEFAYPWPQGALLIMHSDGLHTHWNLEKYPGLATRHPSLIAGILYRDHCRGNDDVTVLVARRQEINAFCDR